MQVRYTIFPFGSMEGVPALAVSISEADVSNEDLDLPRMLLHQWRPGLRAIWLEKCPWGMQGLDEVLLRCMSIRGMSQDLEWVAYRPIAETQWSVLNIAWVVDATQLLNEACTVQEMREAIILLPGYRPDVAEVVVRNPAVENLNPAQLDELHQQLGALGSYIYIDDDVAGDEIDQRARVSLGSCRAPWAVRRLTRQHTVLHQGSFEP